MAPGIHVPLRLQRSLRLQAKIKEEKFGPQKFEKTSVAPNIVLSRDVLRTLDTRYSSVRPRSAFIERRPGFQTYPSRSSISTDSTALHHTNSRVVLHRGHLQDSIIRARPRPIESKKTKGPGWSSAVSTIPTTIHDRFADSESSDESEVDLTEDIFEPTLLTVSQELTKGTSSMGRQKPDIKRLQKNACAIKDVCRSTSKIIRRMLKGREVLEGFTEQKLYKLLHSVQRLNELVVGLRQKLGAPVELPNYERVGIDQPRVLLKIVMMYIFKNVGEMLAETAAFMSGDPVAANAEPDAETEEGLMVLECRRLIMELTAHLDYDELMTPSKALRTLHETRQRFGLSILQRLGLSPASGAVPEDLFEARLRRVFDEFDADASASIDHRELAAAVHLLGIDVTEAALARLLRAADTDGDGTISFPEFKALVASVLADHGIHVARRLSAAPADVSPACDTPVASVSAAAASLRLQRRRSSVVRAVGSPEASPSGMRPQRAAAGGGAPLRTSVSGRRGSGLAMRLAGPGDAGSGLVMRRRKSSLSPVAMPPQQPSRAAAAGRRRSSAAEAGDGRASPPAGGGGGGGYSHLGTGARALRRWTPAKEI